jgi:hypothetical protein
MFHESLFKLVLMSVIPPSEKPIHVIGLPPPEPMLTTFGALATEGSSLKGSILNLEDLRSTPTSDFLLH